MDVFYIMQHGNAVTISINVYSLGGSFCHLSSKQICIKTKSIELGASKYE